MGNRSIMSKSGEGLGSLHVDSIDANSTATESFSEERVVDGQTLFLSPEGAQALDLATDRTWSVHVNGHTWDRIKDAIDAWRKSP